MRTFALVTVALLIALTQPARALAVDSAEVTALRDTVRANPQAIKEAYRLGILLARDGRYDEAIAAWRQLLKDNGATLGFNAQLRLTYAIGATHYKAGRFKRAVAVLKRCREMAPKSAKIAQTLATAETALKEATQDDGLTPPSPTPSPTPSPGPSPGPVGSPSPVASPSPKPCPDGGKAAFQEGDAALTQALTLIEQAQDDELVLGTAIKSLEAARACGYRPERTAYLLGMALVRRAEPGDAARAVTLLEESRKKDDDAKTAMELGVAYGLAGNSDKEIEAHEHAITLMPDWAEAHFKAAIAYDKSGRQDAPRKTFEHAKAAIRTDPKYKTKFQSMLKNSAVAAQIADLVKTIIDKSENGDLNDADVDGYAKQFEKMLGDAGVKISENVKKILASKPAKEFLKKLPPAERDRLMYTPDGQKELQEKLAKLGVTPPREQK